MEDIEQLRLAVTREVEGELKKAFRAIDPSDPTALEAAAWDAAVVAGRHAEALAMEFLRAVHGLNRKQRRTLGRRLR